MVSIDIVSLKQIRDIEHTAGRSQMELLLRYIETIWIPRKDTVNFRRFPPPDLRPFLSSYEANADIILSLTPTEMNEG